MKAMYYNYLIQWFIFQSAVQAAFNDHQSGDNGENDFGFGIDMNDLDVNPNDNDDELALGDLNDIFDADPFSSAGGGTSPSGSPRGAQMSRPGSPGSAVPGSDPAFRSVSRLLLVMDIQFIFL